MKKLYQQQSESVKNILTAIVLSTIIYASIKLCDYLDEVVAEMSEQHHKNESTK